MSRRTLRAAYRTLLYDNKMLRYENLEIGRLVESAGHREATVRGQYEARHQDGELRKFAVEQAVKFALDGTSLAENAEALYNFLKGEN